MDTVFYVRGSKWVEAEVNAEEKPVREWEVMKGFQSESKQLMLNRTGEESKQRDGKRDVWWSKLGNHLLHSTWSGYDWEKKIHLALTDQLVLQESCINSTGTKKE